MQAPALQLEPGPQTFPQLPQSLGLLEMLVQTPPHIALPAGQLQTPATQLSPVGQAVAQEPQWFGLVAGLTHPAPEQ